MDPKSLASNTAVLLALTIQLTGVLHGNWDQKSRPVVERLLYELARLRSILASLEEASLRSDKPVVFGELPHVFKAVKKNLVFLGLKLLGDGDTGDVPGQNASMSWKSPLSREEPRMLPLASSEVDSILNGFQAQTARLRSACSSSFLKISDGLGNATLPFDSHTRKWLWKDCANYNAIHVNAQNNRVAGSGMWLLAHSMFCRWMESYSLRIGTGNNFLHCYGRPGSGKTILVSIVIDELKSRCKSENMGLAYFYFSYRDQLPIYNVVVTLLWQLYIQSPAFATEVHELEKPSLVELIGVLMSVIARFRKAYIVLDALDECTSDNRRNLATLIAALRSSHARLFVTTRSSHIIPDLGSCPQIPIMPDSKEIEFFVKERLRKVSQQQDVLTESQELKIVNALVRMGSQHGVENRFLLVGLQITGLAKLLERERLTDSGLEQILGNLKADLTDVYDVQIRRIVDSDNAESHLARHALSWLYYNTGSMSATALTHILRKEVEEWDKKPEAQVDIPLIQKVCLDLVHWNPDSRTIAFFDFSFYEYLEGKQKLGSTLPMPVAKLAETCIKYLLQPGLANPVSNPEVLDQRLRDFPFLEYSANNWGKLLCQGGPVDFETRPLKSLLTDSRRRLAVAAILFRREPGFFQPWGEAGIGLLHFIAYYGLLRPNSDLPSYVMEWEIDQKDSIGRTPYHIAALVGHADTLDALLTIEISRERGEEALTLRDELGRSVWHFAAEGNHLSVAQILLDKLRGMRNTIDASQIVIKDRKEMTPLCYAAVGGHLEIVQLLLRNRLYALDTEDALVAAIRGKHAVVVDTILRHGVAPKYSHLMLSISFSADIVFLLLLEAGLSVKGKEAEDALLMATEIGNNRILSILVFDGANLEATDFAFRIPLSIAVEKGDVYAVRFLVESYANPNVNVVQTMTAGTQTTRAVTWAAVHGMFDIFRLLQRAGANCSSSFLPAVENGHTDIVRCILESSTAPDLDDALRARAISVAMQGGYIDTAFLLENWKVSEHKFVPSYVDWK